MFFFSGVIPPPLCPQSNCTIINIINKSMYLYYRAGIYGCMYFYNYMKSTAGKMHFSFCTSGHCIIFVSIRTFKLVVLVQISLIRKQNIILASI